MAGHDHAAMSSGAHAAMSDGHGTGAGHDRHDGHSVAMFRDRFWLSLALTVPVVALSPDIEQWFGYTIPAFPGSGYISAVIGTVIFVYGGLVFLRGGRDELRNRQPGM